jgi:hypothetical protein
MKELRSVIQALSSEEVDGIRGTFVRKGDKIARLFDLFRDNVPDKTVKTDLNLSSNSYSTLKSRLNKKVQDYLISQIDGPKTDVLKKVLSIDELMFTQNRSIALTTLKKLEEELITHDLSYELTIIYKHLKKLHVNLPEYFHYSKQYNKHVAYRLALDKAEDILAQYFKAYGYFYVMGDASREVELKALFEEMVNVCALYQSHRMSVYLSVLQSFHSLFVDVDAPERHGLQPVEDVINGAESILESYESDSIYQHLRILVDYVKFEYYLKFGVKRKAQAILEKIDAKIPSLLLHYGNYTFPAQVLESKLKLLIGTPQIQELHYGNLDQFENFNDRSGSIPAKVVYHVYRALSSYYRSRYADAYKWLYDLLNEVNLKEHHTTLLEIRSLMAFFKLMDKDDDVFKLNLGAAQRLLRQIGKEEVGHLAAFVKLLSVANSDVASTKAEKAAKLIEKIEAFEMTQFQPTLLIDWEPRILAKFER